MIESRDMRRDQVRNLDLQTRNMRKKESNSSITLPSQRLKKKELVNKRVQARKDLIPVEEIDLLVWAKVPSLTSN